MSMALGTNPTAFHAEVCAAGQYVEECLEISYYVGVFCLQEGVFSKFWKPALITPIYWYFTDTF